ncbi:SpaA isopeptide-forming pilin-related protein [Lacrimispora sp. 210928-DFI.3.58]|uniref:SpaA isopeptide-forming pilin-related protein n=1 Tax=Lacrimispora sp. 210928-DFI.3.58 TaxID=2883214 RepID=UPI001D07B67C|nr:SpaA isopeptide-forming pilin-related protein [Lacrimispora sp. 210928-DFI.3.58]MCB7319937.1 DUF6273 domain-containing protein [Lacrimispora sp. 210928-DFI.3.58]
MLRKMSEKARRFLALVLSVAMLLTSTQVPAFAETQYYDYLDGWKVQCAWSNLTTDYEWNAVSPETRQPKIVTTYRIENADRDYPAGSISFAIPGIGNANRASIIKASELAADQVDSEWNYVWDQDSDTYTFTNKFEVKQGQSVSGGFEMLWTLSARSCTDGYSQERSPQFSVDGSGSIQMEPLSYAFTSERDRYRISMYRDKLSLSEYENADSDYIWYDIETRFDKDWKARGLYRSDYYVTVEIPDGKDYADVQVKYGGKAVELEQDEDGNWGFYPFKERSGDLGSQGSTYYNSFTIGLKKETLKDDMVTIHGHLDRLYHDESDWITEAGENEKVDDELQFTVDDYAFTYSGYIYSHYKGGQYSSSSPYNGRLNAVNIYNGKIVQFSLSGSANRRYASSAARAKARSRMAAVSATASDAAAGTALLNTDDKAGSGTGNEEKSNPDEKIPEGIEDWNDIHWMENGLLNEDVEMEGTTYGEIYTDQTATASEAYEDEDGELTVPDIIINGISKLFSLHTWEDAFTLTSYAAEETATPSESDNASISTTSLNNPTKPGGNTSGMSQVGENQEYSLVLGDDKLAVFLNDGSIRNLEDEEYDIAYVTIPSDSKKYDYEVYGASTQDIHFDDYVLLGTGNTETKQTIQFPDGVKAVFVRINGIVGSYSYSVYVGVRLHLDWAAEQEKEEAERPDHENRLVNFSYLRALYVDDEGYEVNDCALTRDNYSGSYGDVLADRDLDTYEEQMMRDYSNVWLRSAVTNLQAGINLTSFSGSGKAGFTSSIQASGSIKADNDGPLERFSLYAVIPEGLQVDLDNYDVMIGGSGTKQSGGSAGDFTDHVTIYTTTYNGKTAIVADFDFSDSPLEISNTTTVNMSFPVSLSYSDYIGLGNRYTANAYLMVHDDGIDKVSGSAIMTDQYDIDGDGMITEKVAYANDTETVLDSATEWREYVSKYIKSAYSGGYVTDTVTRLYQESDTEEEKKKSDYSYRLDFGLGSSNAKNIVFFDHIEQGASISVNGDNEGEYTDIASAWQGTFVSVDTSHAEAMKLVPTVYYSKDAEQAFDLSAGGWSTDIPENPAEVKSIAVALDTSSMEDGLMKTRQMTYVVVNMQAPADRSLIGQKAVNQYEVQYDAYGLTNQFEKTYTLPSSETYVKLLDTVGKIILQKVDADHVTKTDEDGTIHYASLTGAKFQVYDSTGMALFEEPKALNSMGRIVLKNVPYGTYYWEEIEAPAGYQKVEGRHTFEIDGVTEILNLENYRIRGEVTLTKQDADEASYGPLSGAVYELYKSNGEQIFTDADYAYMESGTNGTFETDANGVLTVTNLPWGDYYFQEIQAPEGYELNGSAVNFSIGKSQYDKETDSITVSVDAYDYETTSSIRLTKTDVESGRPVRDAVYSLYREKKGNETEDQLISSGNKTNAAGEIEISGLKYGTYYFVETRNPGGYLMPDETAARTESVTLDSSTMGEIIKVTHTNERKDGDVNLVKSDDAGQMVGGAEYELWYRADTVDSDADYSLIGTYTTDSDRNSETYGEISVEGLKWGDYYFVETKAPLGYEVSDEHIEFTVDKYSVQNTIYLETVDNRQKGSVKLVKVDKADHNITLAGAEYELYRTDGTKCVLGEDYELPEGMTTITTGADGSVVISGIEQGGYYLTETKAPDSYSLSTEYIRFSITKENSGVVQELVAEDEKGKAVITINKQINEVYDPFGNPTFIFKITGDGKTYTKAITLSAGELEGKVSFTVDQGNTYMITEQEVSRYVLEKIEPVTNVTVDGEAAAADLVTNTEAEVTFVNRMEQYEKFSHTGNATNIVKAKAKLTGISVEYTGPETITEDLEGYDGEEEVYTFPKSDLIVTAFYDDGTSAVVPASDYVLNPGTADGSSDSYTGTVTYVEDGVTRTDTFQAEIALPEPTPRYQVTFELNGGMIVPDGGNSAQDMLSVQVKAGREVNSPVNEPTKDGYIFKGWYTDSALTTEAVFPVIITKATTFYAMWEQDAVQVKYAVSIYGIQQDTDEEGNRVGLTFGPATGESYVNTYKSHTPSAGQMCMHDMTWDEIIAQSAKDPSVFRECLKNGCTHAVELTITGKLAEGATSYPDMTGDGAGVLHAPIASDYLKWNREKSTYFSSGNEYTYGTNKGGWPDSAIRNTLNGVVTDNMLEITNKDNGFEEAKLDESSALISCFPSELKAAIVPKAVQSDTVYNDVSGNNVTTYDKLWLFSGKEIFDDSGSNNRAIRANEGSVYERITAQGITVSNYAKNMGYSESNYSCDYWLRSSYYDFAFDAYCVYRSGTVYNNHVNYKKGLALGFCLPGPKPDVKYAVSLYGIEHDTYSEDGGITTGTAGLTFGPATGASYVNSYVEHEPTGTTAKGNAHRCIHKDSWTTIAYWSKTDPYVYEQCYGDEDTPSCTKAVPLYLNSKLKGTSYPNMSGDGAGILYNSIATTYRRMNGTSSSYTYAPRGGKGGWPTSKIRATLNGKDDLTNTTQNYAGENALEERESLYSCFPSELKEAIVPKAVQSDTVYNDVSGNNVITYDKLWLFSGRETFGDSGSNDSTIRANEGSVYERITAQGITTSNYAKNAGYYESDSSFYRWLRSPCSGNAYSVCNANGSVDWNGYAFGKIGLAPGFSLKGSE